MLDIEKIINTEKQIISPFELSKEDISAWYLSFNLWRKLNAFLIGKTKNIWNSDIIEKSNEYRRLIFLKLDELDINEESLEKIDISNNGYLKIIYLKEWNSNEIYFDLLDNWNFYKGDLPKIKTEKENNEKNIIKNLEKSDKILEAMDYIFINNKKELFGWELNNNDKLSINKFWSELNWKNLKDLQINFNQYFEEIDKINIQELPENIKNEILIQKSKYLEMVMGIWDKYEWAAKYLRVTEKWFNNITSSLISDYSIKEWLILLKDFHRKIDDNNYQSTSVEKSYKYTMETLHYLLLEKLKSENSSDIDFLNYAKIITWRWNLISTNDIDWEDSDIDDNLRDQEKANDAILYIMNRKWWIIEKINTNKSNKLIDEKVEKKSPSKIVNDLRNAYNFSFWNENKIINSFDNTLISCWYWDIFNLWDKKYSDLNISEKTKISVLYRVLEKLRKWKNIFDQVKEFDITDNSKFSQNEFSLLFKEVAKDYVEDSINKTDIFWSEENFFWERAKEYWFKWIDAEIFELFQDINWVWLLDFSDNTIEWLKATWKFAWVIAVAIAVPFLILPSATIIAQGAAAWAAASVASMAINPKWYDTVWEAMVDISSDIVLWWFTWALWWALAGWIWLNWQKFFATKMWIDGNIWNFIWRWFWVESSEFLSKEWLKVAWVFALDLLFLWLIPEASRMIYLDSIFHNTKVIDD